MMLPPQPPRLSLARLPTPLQAWDRSSAQLEAERGGEPLRIWVKRDDLTGSVLSGNKVRKLEFTLAQALEEGCSILHARYGNEVLIAQTWDMHATAEPFCLMLFLPDEGVWVLTITGCLALCGLSSDGLAVRINNLVMSDARVGISWPTLVRKMLRAGSVEAAEQVLLNSPVGSGHHYALVDAHSSKAWESSGSDNALIYDGQTSPYVHTNHCLDLKMQDLSRISPTSTTHHRYAQATALLEQNPTPNSDELWEMMNCRIDFPNSLFTDRTTEATPHGIATCARVLMDCKRREIWARGGKDAEQTPLKFDWGVRV